MRLGLSARTATLMAVLFAAIPFGIQALTWDSAFSFVFCSSFALAYFIILTLFAEGRIGGLVAGGLSFVLVFLCMCANESLLFTLAYFALFPYLRNAGSIRSALSINGIRQGGRQLALTIPVACSIGAWCIVFLATRPEHFHKTIAAFHWISVLTGILRQEFQITWLLHLGVISRSATLFTWAAIVLLGVFLACWLWKRGESVSGDHVASSSVSFFFLLLPFSSSAIYVLSGGFSLDARKQYPIWLIILIAAFFLIDRHSSIMRRRWFEAVVASGAVVLGFCSSCGVGIWNETGTSMEEAFDLIRSAELDAPYQFENYDHAYKGWPDYEMIMGSPVDHWTVIGGVGSAFRKGDGTTLVWSEDVNEWKVRPDPEVSGR